jgi:hypothetical protein
MSDLVNNAPIGQMGTPPAQMAGGGFPLPQQQAPAYKPPKKGGLPVGVIASIQGVYAREQEKQDRLQGVQQGMALRPGWGGQGR